MLTSDTANEPEQQRQQPERERISLGRQHEERDRVSSLLGARNPSKHSFYKDLGRLHMARAQSAAVSQGLLSRCPECCRDQVARAATAAAVYPVDQLCSGM